MAAIVEPDFKHCLWQYSAPFGNTAASVEPDIKLRLWQYIAPFLIAN